MRRKEFILYLFWVVKKIRDYGACIGRDLFLCPCFIFLGDSFYLRSLIESMVIAVGFYSVMWGKPKKERCSWNQATKGLLSCKIMLLRHRFRLIFVYLLLVS